MIVLREEMAAAVIGEGLDGFVSTHERAPPIRRPPNGSRVNPSSRRHGLSVGEALGEPVVRLVPAKLLAEAPGGRRCVDPDQLDPGDHGEVL